LQAKLKENTYPTLNVFFIKQVGLQTELILENRKKIKHLPTITSQILCPITGIAIDVEASIVSAKTATVFLALFIALSHCAQVDDESITTFLKNNPSYLPQAKEQLRYYLSDSKPFYFTAEQHQFLQKIGIAEAKKKWHGLRQENLETCYRHLWNEGSDYLKNTLTLLKDYNKQHWLIPAKIGLFFTGHLRRHHHEAVGTAIQTLEKESESVTVTLDSLEMEAKKHPKFNPQGSLMSRLAYIKIKGKPEEITELSPSMKKIL
jgi:hypothetical protein